MPFSPISRLTITAFALAALTACGTTKWRSYPDGGIKFSEVKYNYTAQPVLSDPAGKTYQLSTNDALGGVTALPALEKKGLKRAESGADVVVRLRGEKVGHEPGSFGLGGKYKPALLSRMPMTITVLDRGGAMILERKVLHEETLGIPGAKTFATRSEAKAAMASIPKALYGKADEKVRAGAAKQAQKSMPLVAKTLFEPRKVQVKLPAIRSAGDVDMEAAYALLSDAERPEQVQQALSAYEALGTAHSKADGSPDVIGNYGVLCGTASARILAGDLVGAWVATKAAWQTYPKGREHGVIARVLKQQQDEAGVEIMPQEEYNEMTGRGQMQEKLQRLLGGGNKK